MIPAMKPALALMLLVAGTLVVARAQDQPPKVMANDNRTPAGTLANGVMELKLDITKGPIHIEDETGPALLVSVFAETGKAPQNPGPLIRVPEGTEIHATIHNTLKHDAAVFGLHTRPGDPESSVAIPVFETRDVRFRAGAPGAYFYWASVSGARTFDDRDLNDMQLVGAFIVDPAGGAPADRVFVLGEAGADADAFHDSLGSFIVNGKSWPYTERLTYRAGDHARWRWINASEALHPMHLHGAYYNVVATGDAERETSYGDGQARAVVTEALDSGDTMTVDWVPETPGRWVFHCHLAPHFSGDNQMPMITYPDSWGPDYASPPGNHMAHDMTSMNGSAGMAGLVMGITVLPGSTPAAAPPRTAEPRRQLQLVVAAREHGAGNTAAFGYTLRENGQALPAFGTMASPPIVLTQHQPVDITIVNHLKMPTAVHWHGIELDSYYDGVPGWGGNGRQTTPPVAPGGSFVARFAPPRAGTFIYHTHWHDPSQLVKGLYGPLIVLPPGERFDPDTDKIVLISIDGPAQDKDAFLVNGTTAPEPMTMRVGVRYRFRLINITSDNPNMRVSLMDGNRPVVWRAIAKDGADLPESQRTLTDAREVRVSVGETYDFEFVPASAGQLRLDVLRPVDGRHVVTGVTVR